MYLEKQTAYNLEWKTRSKLYVYSSTEIYKSRNILLEAEVYYAASQQPPSYTNFFLKKKLKLFNR